MTSEAPDDPHLADRAAGLACAYVHMPFCARRCPYCDFAVAAGRDDLHPRYAAAVIAEIGEEPPFRRLAAVHFGGGTPSRTDPELLAGILAALGGRFGMTPDVQVALEANPEDLDVTTGRALAAAGFNRITVGAQSFDPAVLAALGRGHRPEDIEAAVAASRRGGFPSIGLDLIFGTPGETAASWRATLEGTLAVYPDHVSCYALTVEPGTELWRQVRAGQPGPDEDDQAAKYEMAMRMLPKAGLVRYEVSNWARPGHASLYNLATWGGGEFVGFGLGAHDHRCGHRRRNVRKLDTYLRRVEKGASPRTAAGAADVVPAGGSSAAERERVFLGLRRAAGVVAGAAGSALWESAAGRRLAEAGVLDLRNGRLVVLDPLRTDAVAREVLAVEFSEC